jgi:hypothetical protein
LGITRFCLGADVGQQLGVSLALLGWQLKNSTDKQEKQKPSQPICPHVGRLFGFIRLASP